MNGADKFSSPSGTLSYSLLMAWEEGHGTGLPPFRFSLLPASKGFSVNFCVL